MTVALTLVSGTTMLLASHAQEEERAAVENRYRLDQATSKLDREISALSDHARQYLNTGDPTYRLLYQRNGATLGTIESRVRHLSDAGATQEELGALKEAIGWADTLHDEQRQALAAYERGDMQTAREILFGAEYEREFDRAHMMIEQFQSRLDQRTQAEVDAAESIARVWKTISEIVLALTGVMFLGVLYFIFKQRVLKPVVRLSDVVSRLAAQDYAVEPPPVDRIDEIGDMAQAIRIFRENGLERQRLSAERDAELAIRDLLSKMTQRMQGCDTLSELENVVKRFVPQIAPEFAGRLYLWDERRGAVVEACHWLAPRHSRPEFAPLACWALRRGLPHQPAGAQIDVPCEHLDQASGLPIPDTLCLPLAAQRQVLGMLYFEPLRPDRHPPMPLALLQLVAENISLALGNLRLRDTLHEMAMTDPLTGLANRRRLDGQLVELITDAERKRKPISCLMIDVDHFKHFNDVFGHEAGDVVLRHVGAVLKDAMREEDLSSRYGGEEFLALLVGLDAEQAEKRAEMIRMQIANLQITFDGNNLGPVTASIGVATAPLHCQAEELVETADAALYRAKSSGRNRVVVAFPEQKAPSGATRAKSSG
ncbi:diguanylate cyclase (GGDEF)-like protein [Sphingobium sp. B8D3D]|nr:diguanylate cyclase (GGDEF)-like protein [Sphingobium sp. B8D3D]MCW2416993.1 diguanylate cyclase (GGDEF)-like protein [Sphingobium sp. B8D3A]